MDSDETESGRLDVPNWTATPRGKAFPCARWTQNGTIITVAPPTNGSYGAAEDSRALQIAQDIDQRENDRQYSFLLGFACGALVMVPALLLALYLAGVFK